MSDQVIKRRSYGKEVNEVTKYTITYKDMFSLEDFVSRLHQWLEVEGYASDDHEFREDYYLQRESPKNGKQIQMWWRVQKNPDDKKMYRFDIDIDLNITGLQQVEFMSDGKKATADKGQIEISVIARIVTDPDDHWKKGAFFKKYQKFIFDKFLDKGKEYSGRLRNDAIQLQNFIKEHLRISKDSPQHDEKLWSTRPDA